MARRQIFDGVLIINECVDDRLKLGRNDIIVKLNLEKANDHVDWMFLDYMLMKLGFRVGGKMAELDVCLC